MKVSGNRIQKNDLKKTFLLLGIVLFLLGNSELKLNAQVDSALVKKVISNTTISGNWFLAYRYNDIDESNLFTLRRGYVTFKNKINNTFSVRFTQDIILDKEGKDSGNVEMRLKYMYLKMKLDKIDFLKHTFFEAGLIHTPWVGFEQDITGYRSQGKMFVDRYSIVSSADFGIMYSGLFGGELDEEYQKKVSSKYPGKYGSFSIGVYNGGGYHALEQNKNKTLEGRISLRPLGESLPGLQVGYAGAIGKGNLVTEPDFKMNIMYMSYEAENFTLMGQYYKGVGGHSGKLLDDVLKSKSSKNSGYSLFGEVKVPNTKFAVFGRYDQFLSESDNVTDNELAVAGLTYYFAKKCKVFFDYEFYKEGDEVINRAYEIVLHVQF